MDDALLVRRYQRLGNLLGGREGFVERNRPLLVAIHQRRPLNQLEDERPDAGRLQLDFHHGLLAVEQGAVPAVTDEEPFDTSCAFVQLVRVGEPLVEHQSTIGSRDA